MEFHPRRYHINLRRINALTGYGCSAFLCVGRLLMRLLRRRACHAARSGAERIITSPIDRRIGSMRPMAWIASYATRDQAIEQLTRSRPSRENKPLPIWYIDNIVGSKVDTG